ELEVADVDGPRGGLAARFPEASELGESSEVRTDVQIGVREQARRKRREGESQGRQPEELVVVVLHALADLAAQGQVRRLRVVERRELQPLEPGQRLVAVAQEAVILPPPNRVDLVADRARRDVLGDTRTDARSPAGKQEPESPRLSTPP